MRKVLSAACLGAMATFAVGVAYANEELIKMSQNPKGLGDAGRRLRQHALLEA